MLKSVLKSHDVPDEIFHSTRQPAPTPGMRPAAPMEGSYGRASVTTERDHISSD